MTQGFDGYLKVQEAAHFLGVCAQTLRNRDRAEKLRPVRHPLNGYRLYRKEDLHALLEQTARGWAGAEQHG